MKNIIYSTIKVFVLAAIAITLGCNTISKTKTIIIQASDSGISATALAKSVQIIDARLKNYSSAYSDVQLNTEKSQIVVKLDTSWQINAVAKLLLQKGELSFYETYDKQSFSSLSGGCSGLIDLLKHDSTDKSGIIIGYAPEVEVDRINAFINNTGLSALYTFAWGRMPIKSGLGLYVLKANNQHAALINNWGIESVKAQKDASSSNYSIEVKFTPMASEIWAKASRNNINKAIAIVLDGEVMYAPLLKSEIKNGVCAISGNFSETEAKLFSSVVSSGVLPAHFRIVR